ncbi:MAG: iron-siderophore ABC transporter substrate-binding protein, partial [Microbacterium sp.]
MRTSRLLAAGVAAALAVGLTACSTPSGGDSDSAGSNPADDSAFPVTIEHVYGETTITEKPERVATVAWANHEVPLALGIVPVGFSKASWGDDDDNGILPWVEEKLDELGGETPVLFDESDGIDFEAVADTQPDVILA